nr:unnamed protein product [Digitaria exilis]
MSDGERHDEENPSTSAADDDDDEDYEEPGGGNHFLGFMFGNVDDSGDLDADYLDEDAKEHLFALADKLGPSLKDIDLIKSSPAPTDPSEQDYDEKAEDAVDYEDIDEEYDGPEVEAATEEDNVLSKKDYFSSSAAYASVNNTVSVFDEENYDEDEETPNDNESPGDNAVQNLSSDLQITNAADFVEEDEEIILRSTIQNFSTLKHIQMNENFVESDSDESVADVTSRLKDSCLSEQPMKDAHIVQQSPVCPDFYPLEHDDWENDIIWNNSPSTDRQPYAKICESEESVDTHGEDHDMDYDQASGCWDVQSKSNVPPVPEEPFGCTEMPAPVNYHSPGNKYPPLTNEDNIYHIRPNNLDDAVKTGTMLRLNNLSLLNSELLEGSWLDNIIWDPSEVFPKPKLIFDLKDDHMLFEILDEKNVDHLRSHARAMIVSQSMKTSTPTVENFDNQAKTLSGRFNISNDKFYSNRKTPQQAKTHTKKRALMGIKVVCCYESMQAGLYRLKRLGIVKLTQPVGLASAMNQLPDEAIELAAASHIERELQITSWNLTSNFVACTNQDRENIERLEITGVGDPSGRGLGFSYVRVAPKAPASNSMLKKKSAAAKGTTVTGTDADLRRLSMDAARELLLKFGVPEEQIDKLTRWHRIAMVRKLSSEQAASGITIDEIPVSKFARGQRMSFLQLQQQTREKCQEIWDRQVQSLSAMDGDDNGSDTEANSDLDSFAGDLENLLDAEEFDDEDTSTADLRSDKADGMRGLKMRRCPTHAQINEEIEDDEAEASLAKKLLEDSGNDMKRKKQPEGLTNCGTSIGANKMKQNKTGQMIKSSGHAGALTPKESTPREAKEAENSFAEGGLPSKLKTKVAFDGNDIILVKKKSVLGKDGPKEKGQGARGDTLVCGACGQLGHMRTNKRCPKYGEDPEMSEMDANSVKSNPADIVNHLPTKTPKRLITKVSSEVNETEGPEDYRSTGKVNKMIIPNKMKSDDFPPDTPKPSVVFRPPAEEKDVPRKKITIKQPKVELSNILEKIVDHLRGEKQISLLFLKPVTRKDAPDYLDFIERPMDLGTIRDKVRKMEYRNRNEFRHDVAQIQLNAHIYNDQRHPHIPPLADSLMELCDYLLDESAELLDEAEDAIEQ